MSRAVLDSLHPFFRILPEMHDACDQLHCAEIRLKTSSAEDALIFPASKASIRDSTSIAHASSIEDVGEGSKLINRRSINSARSTGDNSNAVSIIFSATAVISFLLRFRQNATMKSVVRKQLMNGWFR